MNGMKIYLISNGVVINKHSDGGEYYGWSNPLPVLPPVGSIITYNYFEKSNLSPRKFEVLSYEFSTEETYNHSYKKAICNIQVKEIN